MTSTLIIRDNDLILSPPDHPAIIALKHFLEQRGPHIDAMLCRACGHREALYSASLVSVASRRPCDVLRLKGGSEVVIDMLLGAVGRTLRGFDDAPTPADIDAALLWHAARLSDLLPALPKA